MALKIVGSSPIIHPIRKSLRMAEGFSYGMNDRWDLKRAAATPRTLRTEKGVRKMKIERSCGAVVFTRQGESLLYVIIQSKQGIYGFPKGHMEGAEEEKETALREIAEETGLTVSLVDGFRTEDAHTFYRDGETRMKHIVYFLAEYSGQTPKAQETELRDIYLMDFDSAMDAFQFESSKRILSEAHAFLSRN